MKYIIIFLIILASANFSYACDPVERQVIPGESEDAVRAREKYEYEISQNLERNQVINDANNADKIADMVIVAKVEKISIKKTFLNKLKSVFIEERDFESSYINNVDVQVYPSMVSTGASLKKRTIKLKVDTSNSCGSEFISEFKDEEGNTEEYSFLASKLRVGSEHVFFLKNGKLVYSVEKSLFIGSNVRLKNHEVIAE